MLKIAKDASRLKSIIQVITERNFHKVIRDHFSFCYVLWRCVYRQVQYLAIKWLFDRMATLSKCITHKKRETSPLKRHIRFMSKIYLSKGIKSLSESSTWSYSSKSAATTLRKKIDTFSLIFKVWIVRDQF